MQVTFPRLEGGVKEDSGARAVELSDAAERIAAVMEAQHTAGGDAGGQRDAVARAAHALARELAVLTSTTCGHARQDGVVDDGMDGGRRPGEGEGEGEGTGVRVQAEAERAEQGVEQGAEQLWGGGRPPGSDGGSRRAPGCPDLAALARGADHAEGALEAALAHAWARDPESTAPLAAPCLRACARAWTAVASLVMEKTQRLEDALLAHTARTPHRRQVRFVLRAIPAPRLAMQTRGVWAAQCGPLARR